MENKKININMTGKEFIEYQESKKFKFPKLSYNKKVGYLIIIVSLVFGLIFLSSINEYFNPPKVIEWGYSNLWGVTVHNGLLLIVIFSICLAWIIHGFGFIIVRSG